MTVQLLKKWGNSPAVRIPASVMKAAHLTLDQLVEIRVQNGYVIIKPAAPPLSLNDMIAGITPENRHPEVDFGAPQGREMGSRVVLNAREKRRPLELMRSRPKSDHL